ncbi:hypothetical protein PVAP13_9NG696700 [Panicum virgatum]|uniref:Uncharacterized protein n=1 Tax=Panicum virgatum TaxID=38727 RepID=A0A8T0N029_PANVG|nr:hypothetical protein PVAP13_9NG696700 [Panicum virgatum]
MSPSRNRHPAVDPPRPRPRAPVRSGSSAPHRPPLHAVRVIARRPPRPPRCRCAASGVADPHRLLRPSAPASSATVPRSAPTRSAPPKAARPPATPIAANCSILIYTTQTRPVACNSNRAARSSSPLSDP